MFRQNHTAASRRVISERCMMINNASLVRAVPEKRNPPQGQQLFFLPTTLKYQFLINPTTLKFHFFQQVTTLNIAFFSAYNHLRNFLNSTEPDNTCHYIFPQKLTSTLVFFLKSTYNNHHILFTFFPKIDTQPL